jgi:hypothetical protein
LAVPFANTAHEWFLPAVIATAFARPLTTTGVDEFVVVPFPNVPKALYPQHSAVPFANNAHEWFWPVEITTAVVTPLTTTGVDEFVVVPFPNWPLAFRPQHLAVPFANNAHECEPPAAIAGVTVRAPARCATAPAGTLCDTNPAAINNNAKPIRLIPTPTLRREKRAGTA